MLLKPIMAHVSLNSPESRNAVHPSAQAGAGGAQGLPRHWAEAASFQPQGLGKQRRREQAEGWLDGEASLAMQHDRGVG